MILTMMVAFPAIPFSCFSALNLVWLAAWHTITTLLSLRNPTTPPQIQTDQLKTPKGEIFFNFNSMKLENRNKKLNEEKVRFWDQRWELFDTKLQIILRMKSLEAMESRKGSTTRERGREIRNWEIWKTSYRITLQYKFKGITFRKTSTDKLNQRMLFFFSISLLFSWLEVHFQIPLPFWKSIRSSATTNFLKKKP